MPHHAFTGVQAQEDADALSGVAVMSRWPIVEQEAFTFGKLRGQYVELSGPRGPLQVYGIVMDAWWFDESRARQEAIGELLAYVNERQDEHVALVLGGDFNTDPDSDEIRTVRGLSNAPCPGLSFYDAWTTAGSGGDGHTWANANPWARQLLWPGRRIDYIFTGAPRRGGVGHPLSAALLGTQPVHGTWPSDHYAVQADIRY